MVRQILVGGAMIVAAQTASAAVIVVNGSFSATNWTVYFGTPAAPIDPLTFSYTATFDTDLTYEADTTVLTNLGGNMPYAVTFSYTPSINVAIIATDGTSSFCTHNPETFCAFVADFVTGDAYFVEQSPAGGGGWVANANPPAVPEPASWALMIAGFGLAGTALRRRSRVLA